MKIALFFATLSLTISVVAIAMLYLRHTTRRVINELCQSDAAAEFWLRSADILAYSGSIMLVLIFGNATTAQDLVEVVRVTLILTLTGLFITVMFGELLHLKRGAQHEHSDLRGERLCW